MDPKGPSTGVYAFAVGLPGRPVPEDERRTPEDPEGVLARKPLARACDPANGTVLSSVPWFLPGLPAHDGPAEYRCEYRGGELAGVTEDVVVDRPRGRPSLPLYNAPR